MPLISLWTSNPTAVGEFKVEQVVATAGDGVLKDNSICSDELRSYFAQIESDKLALYAEQCLSSRFDKSGLVLQDLVNELGRRLDYKVTNGRYQGTTNAVGFDGIWISPEGQTIVAEVKTTDAYRISLDTIVSYREKLQSNKTINVNSSILIVVGRQDTGELEAQVRGSRHAWDIRLISVEALIKLIKLKEDSEEPETGQKIRSVLMPVEYTRLDRLVDVMFTTATDVDLAVPKSNEAPISEVSIKSDSSTESGWEVTDSVLLQKKRDQIVAAMARQMKAPLIKKSRALYWNVNHECRIACTISKRYPKRNAYWYAYHPPWDEFLSEAVDGKLVLGCMDLDVAFSIPRKTIQSILPDLNTTKELDRGVYWHLHVLEIGPNTYELLIPKASSNLSLAEFRIPLEPHHVAGS
jgi:hypothetical protein